MTNNELKERVDRLAEVMRMGRNNADVMQLPSESYARAGRLHDEAISIIEEITGEKWDFSFMNWG